MNYPTILILLIFAFSNAEKLSYSGSFKECADDLNNPDQGFYEPVVIALKRSKSCSDSDTRLSTSETVLHLRFDISDFKGESKISNNALSCVEKYLKNAKKSGKSAVVRFSYDKGYDGHSNPEPSSMSTIENHISQLGQKLVNYREVIIAIEAGMLGPWGEMHTSTKGEDYNCKTRVFKAWLSSARKIPILARTPIAIFKYFGKSIDQMERYSISSSDKGYWLGLYNDCFLASSDDEGTYTIDRNRETKWLSNQNKHVPYGGETCKKASYNDLKNAVKEMSLLKLNYLNKAYNGDVISKWKSSSWSGSDSLFNGMRGYDYIKRHLGHRLYLKSISVKYERYGSLELSAELGNSGFGNLLKSKQVDLIFVNSNGSVIQRKNVGSYSGSLSLSLKSSLLSSSYSSYKVYLCFYSSKDGNTLYYPMRLANKNIYSSSLKAHLLFNVNGGKLSKP